jgi:hypothetical protein
MASMEYEEISWERMIHAVEKVRERLERATAALDQVRLPYAVVGGSAVASWVLRVDESAVRNTQDVDILIHRDDLPAAIATLEKCGFVYRHADSIDMFLDGPKGDVRSALKIIFAGERQKPAQSYPSPNTGESAIVGSIRVLNLSALVRLQLSTFRIEDRMLLRDLIDVGLVDREWLSRLPADLAQRLLELLDTPEG